MKKNDNLSCIKLIPRQEQRTLTLEEEPVLELTLTWQEGGPGCPARLAKLLRTTPAVWRGYWSKRSYAAACDELRLCRAASRPFSPWRCTLDTAVTQNSDGLFSICWQAVQCPPSAQPTQVVHTLIWDLEHGCVRTPGSFFPHGRPPHSLSVPRGGESDESVSLRLPGRNAPYLVENGALYLLRPAGNRIQPLSDCPRAMLTKPVPAVQDPSAPAQ